MKKIIALVCMITCIFGLTACDSEVTYTEYEQAKIDYAEQLAEYVVMPYLTTFMDDSRVGYFDEYTAEEVTQLVATEVSDMTSGMVMMNADGNAMKSAVSSFHSAAEAIGTVVSIGTPVGEIDDKTIVVTIPVTGSVKNAEAELIFSNDAFAVLQSAALNEEATFKDSMVKASLNTLIGIVTVFAVLILIIFIISLFSYIPKIQAWFDNRKKKEEVKEESIDNTISQIVEMEEVNVTDDYELVAVIAAAIAASEGAASTDGFVVRSIRKVNRRK